jgi:hypothetical protein
MNNPFFSIAIPTYGYDGKGEEFLDFSFEKLHLQTFQDFEIIVSDHSIDNTIKEICDKWSNKIDIKHEFNVRGRGVISPNINEAIKRCNGKWIKILFQDDFLFGDNSLEKHYEFIKKNENVTWFAANTHVTYDGLTISWSFKPKWVDNIWTGNNKIGSPSNITLKNNDLIYFDEDLNWLMDVDYYMKMNKKFGEIKILDDFLIMNRITKERLTNNITQESKNYDLLKLTKRYA